MAASAHMPKPRQPVSIGKSDCGFSIFLEVVASSQICPLSELRRKGNNNILFGQNKSDAMIAAESKDSNKKCNDYSPHSSSGEGRALYGGLLSPRRAHQREREVSPKIACNTKKETEISLGLSNFEL